MVRFFVKLDPNNTVEISALNLQMEDGLLLKIYVNGGGAYNVLNSTNCWRFYPALRMAKEFFFFSLNDNFIEPWNYTRSTEDLRHVVRWHYIQRDPSYYNI